MHSQLDIDLDGVLARSMAFAPVQRVAMGAMIVALAVCTPWIGWGYLLPLGAIVVVFAILKWRPIHLRLGSVTSWVTWGVGVGCAAAMVLMMDTSPEYVLSLVAVPTMLGCTIFPVRAIPVLAGGTGVTILATGYLADPDAFRADPAPVTVTAVLLTGFVLITAIARGAETDSHETSRQDELTGVLNRLALSEHLAAIGPATVREPWALIVGDIDNFKQINDRWGHDVGDTVLRAVARRLDADLPRTATLYRLGGEEFLVSVHGPDADGATALAERLRAGIADVTTDDGPISMSFGVARADSSDPGRFDALFAAADSALYAAKRAGRDAVAVADVRPTPSTQVERARTPTGTDPRPAPDSAGDRGVIIHEGIEREQLVEMMDRQYRASRLLDLLIVVPLLAFADRIGFGPAILAVVGIIGFRAAQRLAMRIERPERILAPAWIGTQILVAALIVSGTTGRPWGLWGLSLLIVASSAAFPWRFARWVAAISAVLTVAAGALIDGTVLTDRPEAIVAPLCLLFANAVIAREIGRRILAMRRAATFDQLTGLHNRSAYDRRMAAAAERAAHTRERVALVLGDIDHFKRVNDVHGHHRGDAVLVSLASRLQSRLRHDGALFRIGGEEFALLLTGRDADEAPRIAERLRAEIESQPLAGIPVTMSFGVHVADAPVDPRDVFIHADRALYGAKLDGRNRVVVSAGEPSSPPGGGQATHRAEPLT